MKTDKRVGPVWVEILLEDISLNKSQLHVE
jgi:hypothetical protein